MAASRPRQRQGDEFLSDEDLDLRHLSWDELLLWWDAILLQAQGSNELDAEEYAHGVFALPRREWPPALIAALGKRC